MNIAREAEIQMVVRSIHYPTQETDLIRATKSWNEEDFLYAIDRVKNDLLSLSKEQQDQIRRLYRALLRERQDENARIASENASVQRHQDISKRLEELKEISRRLGELKKPAWYKDLNFWMNAALTILTAVLVIVGFLTLHH